MMNNKGLSLVELLIAMAIGSIVASALMVLLTQGVKQYNKQTVTAQLQEDANIAMNNISNSVMEADSIIVTNSGSNTTQFDTNSSNIYTWNSSDGCLYMSGALLCKNVSSFKVSRESGSTDIPIRMRVEIKLNYHDVERSVFREITVRNKDCSYTVN